MAKKLDRTQYWVGWAALIFGALGLAFMYVFAFPHPAASRIALNVGSQTLHLDLAMDTATQRRGLGGRPTMARNEGMLFVFPKPGIYPFWMKGMRYPIDIIWFEHGVVTDVVTLPPPINETVEPATFIPTHIADQVMELNAGMAAALGIEVGSRLRLPRY